MRITSKRQESCLWPLGVKMNYWCTTFPFKEIALRTQAILTLMFNPTRYKKYCPNKKIQLKNCCPWATWRMLPSGFVKQ